MLWYIIVNETDPNPYPHKLYILAGQTQNMCVKNHSIAADNKCDVEE